ncbi:uncharacterized protein TRIVIDRAFT_219877 [Trichoderma virens Gv29-8]|uniref:Uncharacterized protein n=1 Tax=Hypocrea virens (strain Gv29-8 / FGSC 10586) TaxID=413071 RepID=G9MM50_HYPVG|nr:uncharacterized protein TRIVIDRAFT_219877 [Trichoderma virens Gv29-8]EHK24420.1 hypothetical protein TRIVIDRAFT_219877 [Trichoderma virens Gv29-8]UKZ54691.1 hypothetical protein TrVGV298_008503 [Trichoderma virens]
MASKQEDIVAPANEEAGPLDRKRIVRVDTKLESGTSDGDTHGCGILEKIVTTIVFVGENMPGRYKSEAAMEASRKFVYEHVVRRVYGDNKVIDEKIDETVTAKVDEGRISRFNAKFSEAIHGIHDDHTIRKRFKEYVNKHLLDKGEYDDEDVDEYDEDFIDETSAEPLVAVKVDEAIGKATRRLILYVSATICIYSQNDIAKREERRKTKERNKVFEIDYTNITKLWIEPKSHPEFDFVGFRELFREPKSYPEFDFVGFRELFREPKPQPEFDFVGFKELFMEPKPYPEFDFVGFVNLFKYYENAFTIEAINKREERAEREYTEFDFEGFIELFEDALTPNDEVDEGYVMVGHSASGADELVLVADETIDKYSTESENSKRTGKRWFFWSS